MHKKKQFFSSFLMVCLMIANLQAQSYQISFTGSGLSTTVDSVQVVNIARGTAMTVKSAEGSYICTFPEFNFVFVQKLNIMLIHREFYSEAKEALRTYPILVLTEARLTGKTTLAMLYLCGCLGFCISRREKRMKRWVGKPDFTCIGGLAR